MAPNVSQEARDTLPERYGEQFRKYLRDMGVETELLDIADRQTEARRAVEVPASEWTRLHIVSRVVSSQPRAIRGRAVRGAAVRAWRQGPLGGLAEIGRRASGLK